MFMDRAVPPGSNASRENVVETHLLHAIHTPAINLPGVRPSLIGDPVEVSNKHRNKGLSGGRSRKWRAIHPRGGLGPRDLLPERNLEKFASAMTTRLRGDNPAFRKAYVRQLVDRADVMGDRIRITGSKQALLAGLANPESTGKGVVPSFVREWWAQHA